MPALQRRHHRRPRRDRSPATLTYVDRSATLNGSTTGVTFAGTIDHRQLLRGLRRARAGRDRGAAVPGACSHPDLAIGTRVTNTGVVTWNDPTQTASASVSIDVGGIPGVGMLNGSAWHDADFDDVLDASERALAGWTVELYRNGQLAALGADGRDRRLSHQRRRAELRDGERLRAALPRAGRGREHGDARPRALRRSRTTCSGSPTSSCRRAATCRT